MPAQIPEGAKGVNSFPNGLGPVEPGDRPHRDSLLPTDITEAWIKELDADLKHIRNVSGKLQAELIATRLAARPEETQIVFQPGDLVFFQLNPDNPLPSKLSSPFLGPYHVLQQHKNDVECRHLVMGTIKWFHITRLKLFDGTEEEGYQAALLDADQPIFHLSW